MVGLQIFQSLLSVSNRDSNEVTCIFLYCLWNPVPEDTRSNNVTTELLIAKITRCQNDSFTDFVVMIFC